MKLLSEEFSSEYFTKNFSHLLNYYAKEKTKDVSLTYSEYVCSFRKGIGNTSSAFAAGTSP